KSSTFTSFSCANDVRAKPVNNMKSNKKYLTNAGVKISSLAFSEKFTILCKVIANTLNIGRPVKNIGLTALLLAITLLNSSSTFSPSDFAVDVVVIDAGHGGKDSGTSGKIIKEKDVALKIALKVGE